MANDTNNSNNNNEDNPWTVCCDFWEEDGHQLRLLADDEETEEAFFKLETRFDSNSPWRDISSDMCALARRLINLKKGGI